MKTVIRDSIVQGQRVAIGVLDVERRSDRSYDTLALRTPDGLKLMENEMPVPDSISIRKLIHQAWRENADIKVIWPLPKGYIKNLK
jgi:hypothetical protein